MQQRDAMAALGFVEISGRCENRHAFRGQLVKDAPEVAARNRIDAGGRLIQQDHLGPMNERADQAELLLHAAGKFAGQPLAELAHARGLQQLRGAVFALRRSHSEQIGVEANVFIHGQVFI